MTARLLPRSAAALALCFAVAACQSGDPATTGSLCVSESISKVCPASQEEGSAPAERSAPFFYTPSIPSAAPEPPAATPDAQGDGGKQPDIKAPEAKAPEAKPPAVATPDEVPAADVSPAPAPTPVARPDEEASEPPPDPPAREPVARAAPRRADSARSKRSRPEGRAGPLSLVDAVANAVLTHPDIKVSEFRVQEALAGVGVSEAGLYPTLEGKVGVGPNLSSALDGSIWPTGSGQRSRERRLDASVFLRQLVYDFGATDADIDRARLVMDSEKFKVREKIEDVAYRTALAHIKVLETRALLGLVDETIAAHKQLLGIVKANNTEGNGTSADIGRVSSRLTDVSAIRADISLQLLGAEEQFHRLTKLYATNLAPAPSYRAAIPASAPAAIAEVTRNNPRLGSILNTSRSIEREADFQRASSLPRIQIEADTNSSGYSGLLKNRNEFEARAMLSLRYRFLDGGLQKATVSQLEARRLGSEMSFLNEREQLEADVRQAYRAIDSAALKSRLVGVGVGTSRTVETLYLEQFKAGRRTVFELLDSQMSLFSTRRSEVESRYDAHRAVLDVLKAMGRLTATLAGTGHPSRARPG